LDPELVKLAVSLHPQGWPPDKDSADLARLLGTREELVAYLLFKTDFLKAHPEIFTALREMAGKYGSHSADSRPKLAVAVAARDLAAQLHEAVLSIVENESSAERGVLKVTDLDRRRALYSNETSPFVNAPERWFLPK
jgi:hypothetical protein